MSTQASTRTRLFLLPVLIALLLNTVIGPLAPIIQDGVADVLAAPVTLIDENGANDFPGQKDLTQLTVDYDVVGAVSVTFNWDELGTSGENTMDACSLFDTDDDFKANYAVCVITGETPAVQESDSPKIYSCGDGRVDRCTDQVLIAGPYVTTCTTQSPSATDPFTAGTSYPNDTRASCSISLSNVGGGIAELLNVCSYPSQIPHSDPSDCVLVPRDGVLIIEKVATPDDPSVTFNFTLNAAAAGSTAGSGSFEVAVVTGDAYAVAEAPVAGWQLTSATCSNGDAPSAVTVDEPDEPVTCTFNNSITTGTLTVIKSVTNDDGGSATASSFQLHVKSGGVDVAGSPAAGSTTGTAYTLTGGAYVVSEDAVAGYTLTSFGGDCDANGNVTVVAGASKTCTITNADQPAMLTVTKIVNNNQGGSAEVADFPLFIDTTSVTSGVATKVTPGAHVVSETSQTGYTGVISGDCDANGNVSVALGESKSCIITNDDEPGTLTVNKIVSGGDLDCEDFSFSVNRAAAVDFDDSCTNELTVHAGTYSVVESDADGYTTTYSAGCTDAVIASGGSATCTITNTRQTGTLEVVKDLLPEGDDGLFDLVIGAETEITRESAVGDGGTTGPVELETGPYVVGEEASGDTSLGNYSTSIECWDGDLLVKDGAGAGPLMVEVTADADIVCTITNVRVAVGFEKVDDQDENRNVEPGETIHYSLTVTVDNGTATNVEVTDTLPDGLTYVALSADPPEDFSVDGQDLTWTVGTLAEGTHTFEYDATVDADASGPLVNLGCVEADQNANVENPCSSTELLVQNVVVTKTNGTSGSVVPGAAVDFTLTLDVTNGPIDDITIEDQLPAGIANATLISDGGIYDSVANTITWTLTDVVDNETLTYRAVVSATATAGSLTNVATITDGPCAADCDDESTVIVRVPTLVADKAASIDTITISGPNNALVATPAVVTWTVSYTLANGPVTGAVITDEIPTGFTFLDASNGGTLVDGVVTWNLGTLTSSGSVTFRTTVNPTTIPRTGVTNTATIDSNETTPDDGQDNVTVTVEPPPLGGTPTPRPRLPNTATGIGIGGESVTVPVELLVAFFIGSLGALALANVRTSNRRR